MPDRRIPRFLLSLLLSFTPIAAFAQSGGAAAPAAKTRRWIDWQAATLDSRYRVIENSHRVTTVNQVQWRETARLGFLFDGRHRYSLQMYAGTGTTFTGSWDALGPGTGETSWDPNLRQLFLSAAPLHGLAFEVGGLGLVRGEQTEITSWDNDGFMTGERVSLRRPREIFLDEISVTAGFVGDTSTPNVFRRLDRLDDHNYTQVLLDKHVTPRVSASADWTSFDGTSTVREAVRVAARSWTLVDAVRLELYQRVEGTQDNGFAVSAERAVTRTVGITAGYADIDEHYGTLNADRFGRGRSVFTEVRAVVLPTLTVTAYYGVAVNTPFAIPNPAAFRSHRLMERAEGRAASGTLAVWPPVGILQESTGRGRTSALPYPKGSLRLHVSASGRLPTPSPGPCR